MAAGTHPSAATGNAWNLRAAAASVVERPAQRPVRVAGLAGYVDPLGVRPGQVLRIHLNAPAAYEIAVGKLGHKALVQPEPDDDGDRADVRWLASLASPGAARHDVYPGSYAWMDDPGIDRPATISAWVRLGALPATTETSSWAAIISQMDYPDRCGWALGVDADGRPRCYAGDGARHDRVFWCFAEVSLRRRLDEWVHLTATIDDDRVRLWVDGTVAGEGRAARPARQSGATGQPLRIGASGESGVADHLLDGDVSDVALFSRPLNADEVVALTKNRAAAPLVEVGRESLVAHWPLRERRGTHIQDVGGNGLTGVLVNAPVLNLPGPPSSPAAGRAGYDPDADPRRGGCIRFSSDDLVDCEWPAAAELVVPDDADSGTYYVRVTLAGADDPVELPFVVVRPTPRRPRSVALLFATFTWTAYARRATDGVHVPGLMSSAYTRNAGGRLFFNLGMRMPLPRVQPFRHRTHLRDATLHQHLVRPERQTEAWLAEQGYAYECITDAELDAEPALLDRFAALMIVGHNEYWTDRMRDGVETYLRGGGKVLCLSGNTAFWRVSYDPRTRVLETRKTSLGDGLDDAWLPPERWAERWHTDGHPGGQWSHLGRPPSELLGLETLGWIDSGDETAYAPFTICAPGHFLMQEPEEVPLEDGAFIGTRSHDGPAVSGYEMDGLPQALGKPALDPGGLTILGHADHGPRFVAHWGVQAGYGADLILWERPAGGIVFNAGATNYPGALAADPGIQALTRNVLHHMGVGHRSPRRPSEKRRLQEDVCPQ
ncbi:concanavalin A-like lectin/glucanase superfamily protein [Nonomuraea fuscirosea]|uniref:Concanavalin A-like lectin/glucanase superfamily protein n=1 Tax=Nonomuraea fuscirosea TaxID=1291556 RepID=A0A2T0NC56_9ACTN|nr:LamG domain-containing protein [Nonomuraea fuscirosea]PRX70567.1 concanavalin A-like lectin/glucanase superfamily protein [Nonomuraea fuscirosea]